MCYRELVQLFVVIPGRDPASEICPVSSATQPAAHNSTSCTTGVKVALFHEDLLCVEENLPSTCGCGHDFLGYFQVNEVSMNHRTLIKPLRWLHKASQGFTLPHCIALYRYCKLL